MKINPSHYQEIKDKFAANIELIKKHKVFLVSPDNTRKPKDLNKRLRWDAISFMFGSKWICNNLYPYLNDDHIDSALKKIMKDLGI